jgi:hypothetical protein
MNGKSEQISLLSVCSSYAAVGGEGGGLCYININGLQGNHLIQLTITESAAKLLAGRGPVEQIQTAEPS